MSESEKLRRIKVDWEDQHPEQAAERMAARLEAAAIPIPTCLQVPDSAPKWTRQVHFDAAKLYRALVMAGPEGLTLTELQGEAIGRMGQKRQQDAMRLLRGSDAVAESTRGDSALLDCYRIVLRAVL